MIPIEAKYKSGNSCYCHDKAISLFVEVAEKSAKKTKLIEDYAYAGCLTVQFGVLFVL
jgi:hypothetical protein